MWRLDPFSTLIVIISITLPSVLAIPTSESLSSLWSFDGTAFTAETPGDINVPIKGGASGWFGRWLSVGGEGEVTVHLSAANLTLPHRPAAFPAHLNPPFVLPLSGQLVDFVSLPPPDQFQSEAHDSQACIPSTIIRWNPPVHPYRIALVERGGCDFATKIRAAQDRGAAGVIVGDMIARPGETDEEGAERESLITMFSPEDTENIFIPSVFVSRASYLLLRDVLVRHKESHRDGSGPWIDLGEGEQEGGALSSLLSFALLMPSLFLLCTIAIHRVRVARQREADRAPPIVVLSLPERIWSPDIVWEKDDSSSDSDTPKAGTPATGLAQASRPNMNAQNPSLLSIPTTAGALSASPPGSASDLANSPVFDLPLPSSSRDTRTKKERRKYYSKDECAICMDMFKRGEVVRILPCGHVFHKDECDEWLMKWRKLCPTCRADVTLPPGSTPEGSALTPIAPIGPAHDQVDQPGGLVGSIGAGISWVRSEASRRLHVNRRVPVGDDERAPLVGPNPGR